MLLDGAEEDAKNITKEGCMAHKNKDRLIHDVIHIIANNDINQIPGKGNRVMIDCYRHNPLTLVSYIKNKTRLAFHPNQTSPATHCGPLVGFMESPIVDDKKTLIIEDQGPIDPPAIWDTRDRHYVPRVSFDRERNSYQVTTGFVIDKDVYEATGKILRTGEFFTNARQRYHNFFGGVAVNGRVGTATEQMGFEPQWGKGLTYVAEVFHDYIETHKEAVALKEKVIAMLEDRGYTTINAPQGRKKELTKVGLPNQHVA